MEIRSYKLLPVFTLQAFKQEFYMQVKFHDYTSKT